MKDRSGAPLFALNQCIKYLSGTIHKCYSGPSRTQNKSVLVKPQKAIRVVTEKDSREPRLDLLPWTSRKGCMDFADPRPAP